MFHPERPLTAAGPRRRVFSVFHPEITVPSKLLTEKQAEKLLQVSRTTLWRLRAEGGIPHVNVGGQVRYERKDLQAWIARQKADAPTPDDAPLALDECRSAGEEAWCSAIGEQDWGFHDEATNELTHALHPYPAKFPPPLPRRLVEILTRPGDTVLDPFCGSGTTLVEALRLDRATVGTDINPVGVLVSEAKTLALAAGARDQILALQRTVQADADREGDEASLIARTVEPVDPSPAPAIPNIANWFEPIAIRELGIAVRRIGTLDDAARVVARAALSSILVQVSNQDSETRYTARPRGLKPGEVLSRLARRLGDVASMHSEWGPQRGSRACRVLLADARTLTRRTTGHIHAVVTSPPYANAFDYHLYHRHRMFWLGHDPGVVRDLEIGSHLNHQREKDGVASYRDDMAASIRALSKVLRPGAPCAFVVGDSVFHGATVNNARVIAQAGREAGFRCVAVAERAIHPIKRSMIGPARRARIERVVLLVRSA